MTNRRSGWRWRRHRARRHPRARSPGGAERALAPRRRRHSHRLHELYALFFLGDWAAGVTLGHLGKLLSLSALDLVAARTEALTGRDLPSPALAARGAPLRDRNRDARRSDLQTKRAAPYGGSVLICASAIAAPIAVARTLRGARQRFGRPAARELATAARRRPQIS